MLLDTRLIIEGAFVPLVRPVQKGIKRFKWSSKLSPLLHTWKLENFDLKGVLLQCRYSLMPSDELFWNTQ